MDRDTCPICLNTNVEIMISHVIPNAIFRRIKENGQAWEISTSKTSVERTQDSWASRMLCGECEKLLNERFENRSLNTLRLGLKKPKCGHYVSLRKLDSLSMAYFILSIAWRASRSKHSAYQDICFSSEIESIIRKNIFEDSPEILEIMSFRIYHLTDSRGYFDESAIQNMIITPYQIKNQNQLTIVFIFEGYRFDLIIPSIPQSHRTNRGVLVHKREILKVPSFDLWSDPGISETLIKAGKAVNNESELDK